MAYAPVPDWAPVPDDRGMAYAPVPDWAPVPDSQGPGYAPVPDWAPVPDDRGMAYAPVPDWAPVPDDRGMAYAPVPDWAPVPDDRGMAYAPVPDWAPVPADQGMAYAPVPDWPAPYSPAGAIPTWPEAPTNDPAPWLVGAVADAADHLPRGANYAGLAPLPTWEGEDLRASLAGAFDPDLAASDDPRGTDIL